MSVVKAIGFNVALTVGGPFLLRRSPRECLTTILFHNFAISGEPVKYAREGLKRQCDWLRKHYSPLTLTAATHGLRKGGLPQRPLLITIDDAHIDILDVIDIFESFDLPIAMFVCVGWTANASPWEDDTLLARAVTDLEWYSGSEKELSFPCGTLKIRRESSSRRDAASKLIKAQDEWRPYLKQVVQELNADRNITQRNFCNWQELKELQRRGVEMGCHSVSHMNLVEGDQSRMNFEIFEAKRILVGKLGESEVFAYPFGGPRNFNHATSELVQQAGFRFAFLTHSDFADGTENPLELPRIPLPDPPLSMTEFRARVAGGGIVISKLRDYFRRFSGNLKDHARF